MQRDNQRNWVLQTRVNAKDFLQALLFMERVCPNINFQSASLALSSMIEFLAILAEREGVPREQLTDDAMAILLSKGLGKPNLSSRHTAREKMREYRHLNCSLASEDFKASQAAPTTLREQATQQSWEEADREIAAFAAKYNLSIQDAGNNVLAMKLMTPEEQVQFLATLTPAQ